MQTEINEVDLAFVVDTTASMGCLIRAAQQHSMVRLLSRELIETPAGAGYGSI